MGYFGLRTRGGSKPPTSELGFAELYPLWGVNKSQKLATLCPQYILGGILFGKGFVNPGKDLGKGKALKNGSIDL